MKNILIVGPARVGKTTLSKFIVHSNVHYSVINVDVIREGIYKGFFKDVDKEERRNIVTKAFPDILREMLKQYTNHYNPDIYYVIEGDMLSIENAIIMKEQYDVEVVCVGVPNMTKEDLFDRTRQNAAKFGCWTNEYSDSELLGLCQNIIDQSKREVIIAKDNDLIYLDTSFGPQCLIDYVESLD